MTFICNKPLIQKCANTITLEGVSGVGTLPFSLIFNFLFGNKIGTFLVGRTASKRGVFLEHSHKEKNIFTHGRTVFQLCRHVQLYTQSACSLDVWSARAAEKVTHKPTHTHPRTLHTHTHTHTYTHACAHTCTRVTVINLHLSQLMRKKTLWHFG